MENVVISVSPVNIARLVAARLLDRLCCFCYLFLFGLGRFSFFASICILIGRLEVHFVGINDFGFFFKIESFFMVFDVSFFVCVAEILFVVGENILRVGVSDESICAACHSAVVRIASG